jgi:hypothetical protein
MSRVMPSLILIAVQGFKISHNLLIKKQVYLSCDAPDSDCGPGVQNLSQFLKKVYLSCDAPDSDCGAGKSCEFFDPHIQNWIGWCMDRCADLGNCEDFYVVGDFAGTGRGYG